MIKSLKKPQLQNCCDVRILSFVATRRTTSPGNLTNATRVVYCSAELRQLCVLFEPELRWSEKSVLCVDRLGGEEVCSLAPAQVEGGDDGRRHHRPLVVGGRRLVRRAWRSLRCNAQEQNSQSEYFQDLQRWQRPDPRNRQSRRKSESEQVQPPNDQLCLIFRATFKKTKLQ